VCPAESGWLRARKVDHVTRDVVREIREQTTEGRSSDRPAMNEQHVRAVTDAAVRDLPGLYRQASLGLPSEKLDGVVLSNSAGHATTFRQGSEHGLLAVFCSDHYKISLKAV
jgi:hypothetical protein